ncbi:microcin C transport system substrate-binding protein [Neisseria sp. HSC-16F19]|nr:extracellular solute-binding protein [Neisseria sp. HSC-16F19]MCP2040796.1 microcin C transport system substrate-binding protein [Neisseria sp. HSC-16F19]
MPGRALPSFLRRCGLFAAAVCVCLPVEAEHAMSLGAPPQYAPGFTHFGYVNPDAPKGGSFNMPWPGGFDTLNPYTLKGDKEMGVGMLTVESLMTKGGDEPFAMYGLLAEDISLAADKKSVTFRLNPKARFHNGDAVTARDVVESFKLLTEDKDAAPFFRHYWADVARVVAADARTVRFEFKKPNAELHLIVGEMPVFSHKSYPQGLAAGANRAPIGSGPYRLLRAENNRSEFARDRNYWAQNLPTRKGKYNFDTVRIKYYRDDAAKIEGMKAGQYDALQEFTARLWARAYSNPDLMRRGLKRETFEDGSTAGLQGFVLNSRRKPLDDIRVRRALVLSFDYETVNKQLFYNSYRRSNSYFTNSEMAARGLPNAAELALLQPLRGKLPEAVFRQPVPEPPQTDPQLGVRPNLLQARALLEEAGYRYRNGRLVDAQGKPLQLTFLTYSKTFERVVAKWQRDLAKIGVDLRVRVTDSAVFQRRMQDFDFDISIVSYANSESPGNEQFEYFSCRAAKTPGSRNWSGVCDPAVEALLPHFERFENRAELVAAAQSLDRVLRHQYLVVPNWHSPHQRVVYWDRLGHPARPPKYFQAYEWVLSTWWVK